MVLDLLVIGLIITLFPLPIMAFVLVVSAPRGTRKGLAFILAWLACLVTVIAIVLFLTGGQPPPPRSPPSVAALAATLVIGLGLIFYSEHRRRRRRRTASSPDSAANERSADSGDSADSGESLNSRMDDATGWSAAALAVLLQPWGMVGAAAATVVQANLSHGASFVALMAFCLLATSTLLAMELYAVFSPEKAQRALRNMRAWLERHKEPAIVVTCLVLGLWLVGRSLYQLTG
ncbi:GAP family protein [Streptomyces sp. NBC_01294]|uniref:GAP family protein n=1 Tax=Streptomyces sp. NBC_01294 TaxID=2903815 RepID=UPI002DDA789F|nr:GAP family protein [Streptomyces sp. NBC_01294]WRZ55763.1 GAP family protein [Streptomyces sp. NBC_01294]